MDAVIQGPGYVLRLGDSRELLAKLKPNSIDALVCDPPAGISFMGKEWDHDHGGRDGWIKAFASLFALTLATMKPGAHGLVWALPRTSHWTATALEDAGFELRDVVMHLFGTGFPKSLNVAKATEDARFDGWGTALKPAAEHWILVRKPLIGTVAENVLEFGTGGLNIDASRIGSEARFNPPAGNQPGGNAYMMGVHGMPQDAVGRVAVGRFPSHLILDEEAAAALDAQSGTLKTPASYVRGSDASGGILGKSKPVGMTMPGFGDTGGASRFFKVIKCDEPANTAELNSTGDLLHGGDSAADPAKAEVSRGTSTPRVSTPEMPSGLSWINDRNMPPIQNSDDAFSFGFRPEKQFPSKCPACGADLLDLTGIMPITPIHLMSSACAEVATSGSMLPILDLGGKGGENASRFKYVAKPGRKERDAGCDDLPPRSGGDATDREEGSDGLSSPRAGAGRGGGARNVHPTVKSIELMKYLIRLITPSGGIVLDPFMGSGSTGCAAITTGFKFVGIERESEYFEIAKRRIAATKGMT
jgi:hypothetical protein